MAVETFGSSIGNSVVAQFKIRAETHSSKGKTPENLTVLNSNTAWIQLRSGVDEVYTGDSRVASSRARQEFILNSNQPNSNPEFFTTPSSGAGNEYPEPGSLDPAKNIEYSSDVAKSNKLGTSSSAGVESRSKQTKNSAAYIKTDTRGFRPKPGITGFKAETKNTYGTLRQAEVQFTVWSLEDLQAMETCFFRPGFSALLEWGHSLYYDNSKNMNSIKRVQPISDDIWYARHNSAEVENKIKELRRNSDNNYDAMFGIVYNFSWSFRVDGGYDCTVKLVSKGIVLESIKIPPASSVFNIQSLSDVKTEFGLYRRRSPFHYLFTSLDRQELPVVSTSQDIKDTKVRTYFEPIEDFRVFRHFTPLINSEESTFSDSAYYISLKTFLDIYNRYGVPNARNVNINSHETLLKFNTVNDNVFNTFAGHFSLNPKSAVIPKIPIGRHRDYILGDFTFRQQQINPSTGFNLQQQSTFKKVAQESVTYKMESIVQDKSNRITNIMVSLDMVLKEIDKLVDGNQEEGVGFLDVMKGILAEIQSAFGEINDFDISYDEDSKEHFIIDRKTINNEANVQDIALLNLTGLQSTITNLNVSSKISNQIASQIAIAAQSFSPNYSEDVSSIMNWNRNLTDRHLSETIPNYTSTENNYNYITPELNITLRDPIIGKIGEMYRTLNPNVESLKETGKPVSLESNFTIISEDMLSSIKQEGARYFQYLINKEGKERPTKGVKPYGTIPVELSFKCLGISGLKVGQTFKVSNGVLPEGYSSFAFVITGVSHSIEANKWYTEVKTQFFKPSRKVD